MKKIKGLCALVLLSYALFKIPIIHYKLVRSYVGSKTVVITFTDDKMDQGGGTGVHVRLPHGGSAILTNAHVCAIKDVNGDVMVESPLVDRPIKRHVIEESEVTDLCLVQGIDGISGLKLGNEVESGDIIAIMGHPYLMPPTMTRGEVIGEYISEVMDHVILDSNDKSCSKPKNKIKEFQTWLGPVTVCLDVIQATYTTIPTFPGNSGSAAIDYRGKLVGLVFAGNNRTNWGLLVTLKDIRKFLAPY